jgi:hypothetical protein
LDELWTVVRHDVSPDPAAGFTYWFSPASHETATSRVSDAAIFATTGKFQTSKKGLNNVTTFCPITFARRQDTLARPHALL